MSARKLIVPVTIAAVLILVCVALRMASRDGIVPPNFSAVAACAIFAGFLFRRTMIAAIAVPLGAMLLSDWVIGGHTWQVMLVVYAALALPVLLGRAIAHAQSSGRRTLMVPLSSLAASLIFFISTNLATFAFSPMYSPTLAGLTECFVSALPFFRYTVLGDLVCTSALFGLYAAVVATLPAVRRTDALAGA